MRVSRQSAGFSPRYERCKPPLPEAEVEQIAASIGRYAPADFAVYGRRCNACGRSDLPLEAHHVNGDVSDNRISNLVPLCRDCHRSAAFPGI